MQLRDLMSLSIGNLAFAILKTGTCSTILFGDKQTEMIISGTSISQ